MESIRPVKLTEMFRLVVASEPVGGICSGGVGSGGSKNILQLIGDILSPDCRTHSEAFDSFEKICTEPGTAMTLSKLLVVSGVSVDEREQAACLLRHCLCQVAAWHALSETQQSAIKREVFRALHNASMPGERESLTRCLGVLMRHELGGTHDSWLLNIFKYVQEKCSCADAVHNQTGSSVFLTLAQAEPAIFVPFLDTNLKTFLNVLHSANKCGKFATPVVTNMLEGVAQLVCNSKKGWHRNAQMVRVGALRLIETAAPLIVKALRALVEADLKAAEFMRAHKLLEQLAEYTPHLLAHNYRDYMRHAVELASDETLMLTVRVVNFQLIGSLVTACPLKVLRDRQLLSSIVELVFGVLVKTLQHDAQDELDYVEEVLLVNSESEVQPQLANAAIEVIHAMAVHLPVDQFITQVLHTLRAALVSKSAEIRRTVHVCVTLIVEDVKTLPRDKTMEKLLQTLQLGIADSVGCVQCAAYTELCYFTEKLQPAIFDWTDKVLPLLHKFIDKVGETLGTVNLRLNQTHLIFTALESFCSMAPVPKLQPHLPQLMCRLFVLLHETVPVALNVMSLSAISSLGCNMGTELLPYFDQLMSKLMVFLVRTDDVNMINVRSQAMDTIANIASCFSREHFQSWADDILDFTVETARDELNLSDPFVQVACYKLIGALARIVGPRMSEAYSVIIERLYISIAGRTIITTASTPFIETFGVPASKCSVKCIVPCQGARLEQEEAIHTLRRFAEQTPHEFAPFAMNAFYRVYKLIDHAEDGIRNAVCLTLTGLLLMVNTLEEPHLVKETHHMLMPKLVRIVREVENVSVVRNALKSLDDIVRALGECALPQVELADALFLAVQDIINEKAACSCHAIAADTNDDNVRQLYHIAANLFPNMGRALTPERYKRYFPIIPRLLNSLLRVERLSEQSANVYDSLTQCIEPLGAYCANYFDDFCPMLMRGLVDSDRWVRRCSFFGIGELVYHAGVSSTNTMVNLGRLMTQRIVDGETDQEILDIYCGSIARILIVNHQMAPLAEVLPVLFDKLPIRQVLAENSKIIRCLSLMFEEARAALEPYVPKMIELVMQLLFKQQMLDDKDGAKIALRLLKKLHDSHFDKFKAHVKSHPDAFMFVVSQFKK